MMKAGNTIYLERRDPRRNMARYYMLSVEQDLFGAVLAVRRWGRIGSWGRRVSMPCPGLDEALAVISGLERAKRLRGYAEPARLG